MIRRVASLIGSSAMITVLVANVAPALAKAAPAPPAPIHESLVVASYGSGGVSKVQLAGTELVPKASGAVKVAIKQGSVQLAISVRDLPAPTIFGPEFLSYVVWAVTAAGQTRNLGEIVVVQGKGKLQATTHAQAFGLLLTAEPYFAVSTPSDRIVLRNSFAGKVTEAASVREARFEAAGPGTYAAGGLASPDSTVKPPFDLFQARNALRVARAFGAEAFAGDLLARASDALVQAEAFAEDRKKLKLSAPQAREAVESAEAARSMAVRRMGEARVAEEQADAGARATTAREEAARAQADAAAAQSAAARAQADAAAAQSAAARAQATAEEEMRRRTQAEQSAAASDLARRQAEVEKQALRARLLKQFNLVLETRDSARGLIVNLGDVLFDLDKFTLRSEAREKLAKLSGIVLGNPGLELAVEGHTDATGSDEYNQKLSEERAGTVRDYLVEQKIDPEMISALGFGKTRPVAPNDTPEDRQKNRRVEIVVSGDVIGTEIEQQKAVTPPPH